MNYFQAILLGVVQGLTEFLPVSSSGHLVLFQHFLKLEGDMLVFDIFLHFATLLAVIVVFRSKIMSLATGALADLKQGTENTGLSDRIMQSKNIRYILAIVLGTVPAVLIGFTLKDTFESLFSSMIPVLFALTLTGCILIATLWKKAGNREIGIRTGVLIGIAQAMAIMPGISRSGSTISTAIFLGIRRSEAGEFSFLLSLPAIMGATLLAVLDLRETGLDPSQFGLYFAGMLAAFLSGLVSLKLLMAIVRRGKIAWFGFYCLALVTGVLILRSGGSTELQQNNEHTGDTLVAEQHIVIHSSIDNVEQNMRVFEAPGDSRPLLIALHTWSFDYTQDVCDEYFEECSKRGWHCVFPNFRGPNDRPEACASTLAMQDIMDAVNWATENLAVDHRRIFLCGTSGGGHMALQMAGNFPSTWTAVSAWVGISDLARWHAETNARGMNYSENVELICGGSPGASALIDKEYKNRSPLTSLWRANIIPVDINAGIHDGHGGDLGGEGSVPVGQSIRAFNEIAKAAGNKDDIISEDIIELIESDEKVPDYVMTETSEDPSYGRKIHLRRTSGLSRLSLFEGGHEIVYNAAFTWFENF